MNRTPVRLFVLALTTALAALVLTVPASAAASPYCGITWGSLAKGAPLVQPAAGTTLVGVRAGRHDCYDRLVLDIRGATSLRSWYVSYTSRVTMDGSGDTVPLRGGAFLQINLSASDHDEQYRPTYRPANRRELVDVAGYTTFRQVATAGSFEAVSSVGLGVRARLPFRVHTLSGIPGDANGVRLVIDVAHRW